MFIYDFKTRQIAPKSSQEPSSKQNAAAELKGNGLKNAELAKIKNACFQIRQKRIYFI